MKILYIIKEDPDSTLNTLIEENRKSHDVTVIDLRAHNGYGDVVDQIFDCDRLITW